MAESKDKQSKQAKAAEQAVFGVEDDVSCPVLADNKKILHIVESFIVDGSKKLSSFLRKKMTMELSSINACSFDAMDHHSGKTVVLAFQIEPGVQFGLISFDLVLLHAVIELLYGGVVSASESVFDGVGHAGIRIVRKVAELCLSAFQEALNEHLKTEMVLSNLSTSLYSVFNQKLGNCCHFDFKLSIDAVSGNFHVAIPEHILVNIVSESGDEHVNINAQDDDEQDYHFSGQLKEELIDSKVMIHAVLPDIVLLVKDVVNLRAGDIIPVGDPTFVYLAHNQKKLFTATAGQSNSRRIVEIIDTV